MRGFPRMFIVLAFMIFLDIYLFQAVRLFTQDSSLATRRAWYFFFWSITAVSISLVLAMNFTNYDAWNPAIKRYIFPALMLIYISKVVTIPFLLFDDLQRLIRYVIAQFASRDSASGETIRITRSQFIVGLGLIIAAIPFSTLLFGMLRGPYKFKVRRITVNTPQLPAAFDGYTIVQLSDIHTGSWKGTEPMEHAVRIINDLKADVVLFTGDLVNNISSEALPYVDTLRKIKVPDGVYSSLGNHDYGDYSTWPDTESKRKNLLELFEIHKSLGWNLLRNEWTKITRSGESIVVAGVENWGAKGNFSQYGDLKKTLSGLRQEQFIILMSHDPSHWKAQILEHPAKVDLTLAGHTHGMQYGADFAGFRISPVQLMYKEWIDLYHEGVQKLYVNRGLGFIGYPGRFGIDPEITHITLRRS